MKLEKVWEYFLPHPTTHKKARLLSWHYLVIYALLFILLRTSIDIVTVFQPGVLGIESSVSSQQIIIDTNKERQALGLSALSENSALDQAAQMKAKNMFEENYWAHFSPSGKDPWGFILGAGYKFSFAGENLARNFYNSDDVVRAWMKSPAHKENIVNPNYEEIGIAVVDGVLNGQKTTLVVQMFGKSYQPLAAAIDIPQMKVGEKQVNVPVEEVTKDRPVYVAGVQNALAASKIVKPVADPYFLIRVGGMSLILFIAMLIALDFMVLRKRGVFRVSTHHFAHLSFLAAAGASLYLTGVGQVL